MRSLAEAAALDPPLVKTATRVFAILERLSRERSVGLDGLARDLGLAKPTIYRFLLTLQQLGYARRVDGERWGMTLRPFNIGSRVLEHMEFYAAARPVAEELAESLGETVHMGVLDGDSAIYVLKVESRYTIRMHSRVGRHIPLHGTAIGKVLLAHLPGPVREAVLEGLDLVPFTPDTLTGRSALRAELDRVRRRGCALDAGEHEEGIRCIGAPVFDPAGAVAAALSVSWPECRYCAGRQDEYIQRVKAAADRITAALAIPLLGARSRGGPDRLRPGCEPPTWRRHTWA
jgi:IclR family KDG regulon transcriptional repressor